MIAKLNRAAALTRQRVRSVLRFEWQSHRQLISHALVAGRGLVGVRPIRIACSVTTSVTVVQEASSFVRATDAESKNGPERSQRRAGGCRSLWAGGNPNALGRRAQLTTERGGGSSFRRLPDLPNRRVAANPAMAPAGRLRAIVAGVWVRRGCQLGIRISGGPPRASCADLGPERFLESSASRAI